MSLVDYFCLSVFGYFCFCQITVALLYPSTRPKRKRIQKGPASHHD